jgi:hypothetical protein
MFRQNLDPGSPNVFLSLIPSNKIYFADRTTQSGSSANISPSISENVPYWLRIYNKGNKYVSYISANGDDWTATDSVTLALGTYPYVGIAYTTHNNSVLDTAVVDNVKIEIGGVLSSNLINFNAKNVNDKKALLKWTTIGEINNNHFEIQRSGVFSDFKTIGTIKGAGNTTQTRDYTFTDNYPKDGTNYYRIKLIDDSGNTNFSPIVPVKFNFKKIEIYPNPAQDKIYIRNNNKFSNGENLVIKLLDFSGKVLNKEIVKSYGADIITFNIPKRILNGIYIITVTNSAGEMQGDKVFINR